MSHAKLSILKLSFCAAILAFPKVMVGCTEELLGDYMYNQ